MYKGSHLMADKAMANVSFSLGPIHLTVTYINFPVSTYLLHFGSHSTILWSEVPSSDIVIYVV